MVDPFASWSSLCLTVCRSSAVTHLDDLLHARGCGGLSHWDDGVFSPGQSGPICGRVSVLCANWLCTRDVRGQREGDPMLPPPAYQVPFRARLRLHLFLLVSLRLLGKNGAGRRPCRAGAEVGAGSEKWRQGCRWEQRSSGAKQGRRASRIKKIRNMFGKGHRTLQIAKPPATAARPAVRRCPQQDVHLHGRARQAEQFNHGHFGEDGRNPQTLLKMQNTSDSVPVCAELQRPAGSAFCGIVDCIECQFCVRGLAWGRHRRVRRRRSDR